MRDTATTEDDDKVYITVGLITPLRRYSSQLEPDKDYEAVVKNMNDNFKNMPHFRETPVEVMDTWTIMCLMHHVKSTCILADHPHELVDCMAKLLDRWQEKRIFAVAKEEKLDTKGTPRYDMPAAAVHFARRANQIFENTEAVFYKNEAESNDI